MVNGQFFAETIHTIESGHWFPASTYPLSPDVSAKHQAQYICIDPPYWNKATV